MNTFDSNPNRSRKQRWALAALIAATSASVALSLNAWAGSGHNAGESFCPEHAAMHERDHRAHAGPMMPFAGRKLDRMLSHVDATDVQKKQIRDLASQATQDLKSIHEEGRSLREQGLALWAAPQLDAKAAEQLRQKMASHHDQMSQRMLTLMMDIGQVLTPEQRAKMAQHLKAHSRWHSDAGKPGAGAAKN